MIPVKLTIEGLYSYQERQTIDFTQLTDAGLFGIFGATGSGKSSILEAISYALYGDIERLNIKERRTYNMMNLKSNRVYIEFDFYNNENKLYRATRDFKRNTKRFDDIRTPKTVFYEYKDEEWVPLDYDNAEPLIGLPYRNFKRTIIIPQGRFMEFIELGAAGRTEMLKELFQLQRFDLQNKTAEVNRKNQSELDTASGLLAAHEDVSENMVQQREAELQGTNSQLEIVQKEYLIAETIYQNLKHLKSDFDLLSKKKQDFAMLQKRLPEMDTDEKKLDDYEKLYKMFYQLLTDLETRGTEVERRKAERTVMSGTLANQEDRFDRLDRAIKEITPYFEQLPQRRDEETDLQTIIRIIDLRSGIAKLSERKAKGRALLDTVLEELKKIRSDNKLLENEITQLKSERTDAAVLRSVGQWFQTLENLNENFGRQKKKLSEKQQELRQVEETFADAQINAETFEQKLLSDREAITRETDMLNAEKDRLALQQKLTEHAHQLHDGEACPLCGSLDHPHILVADDVSGEMKRIQEILNDLRSRHDALNKKELLFVRERAKQTAIQKELLREQEECGRLNKEIQKHRSSFQWSGFDPANPDDFKRKQRISDQREKLISEKEEQWNKIRKIDETETKKSEKYEDALILIEREEGTSKTEIAVLQSALKQLNADDFSGKNRGEVEDMLSILRKKNRETEEKYQKLSQEINHLIPQIASQKTSLHHLDQRINELTADIAKISDEIDKHIKEENLPAIGSIRKILREEIDVAGERKRILDFRIAYQSLSDGIDELEQKLTVVSFSESLFETEKEKWKQLKDHFDTTHKKSIELQAEVRRLKEELKEKQRLEKRYLLLEKRAENLKILLNLFRSSGFVQYVSTVFLGRLCHLANIRFQQMTRNQLRLQINANNDFEIIDYLNEGKSRSIKTLSGGQLFQVSLSLALALSESVQTQTTSGKKFFFIDEGFGTQDPESINIIFETLLNLNRENKIVGIISHVEELKDRIPVSLTVEKDPDRGSLIKMNI